MSDGTFVKELVTHLNQPTAIGVNNTERGFLPPGWTEVGLPKQPSVIPIHVNTLTGLVDYLVKNVDSLQPTHVVVHVQSPQIVEVLSHLGDESEQYRRHTYMIADAGAGEIKSYFGSYMEAESFSIWLRTGFVKTPQREELIALLASIRDSSVKEVIDTGVSQEVKTARGVHLKDNSLVPSEILLQPYRTFREVDQPASVFILRLQSNSNPAVEKPRCALFESDGQVWRLDAILEIAEFLREKLASTAIQVLA